MLRSDEKSRTMRRAQCLVDLKSSVQGEEQGITVDCITITCVRVIVISCQAIVVHQLVKSWLVSLLVVYNFASYGPELYAGTATPDASINSHIVIEKSQGRVNFV